MRISIRTGLEHWMHPHGVVSFAIGKRHLDCRTVCVVYHVRLLLQQLSDTSVESKRHWIVRIKWELEFGAQFQISHQRWARNFFVGGLIYFYSLCSIASRAFFELDDCSSSSFSVEPISCFAFSRASFTTFCLLNVLVIRIGRRNVASFSTLWGWSSLGLLRSMYSLLNLSVCHHDTDNAGANGQPNVNFLIKHFVQRRCSYSRHARKKAISMKTGDYSLSSGFGEIACFSMFSSMLMRSWSSQDCCYLGPKLPSAQVFSTKVSSFCQTWIPAPQNLADWTLSTAA